MASKQLATNLVGLQHANSRSVCIVYRMKTKAYLRRLVSDTLPRYQPETWRLVIATRS